jgi:hypothetical protein
VLPRWNLKGDREPEITGSSRRSERQFDPGFPNGIVDSGEPREPSTRTVTREGLYRRVWSSPATHVAADLGITSTALAKIARKLDVPVPPPGFWARKRAGQSVEVLALPAPLAGQPTRHVIVRRAIPRPTETKSPPEAEVRRAGAEVRQVERARPTDASARPLEELRTPTPVSPEEAMLAAASRGLAALERVATLRAFVERLTPIVVSLPADSPQRRWLDDARAQIARAEAEALAALG